MQLHFWTFAILVLVSLLSIKGVLEHLFAGMRRAEIKVTASSAESYGKGLRQYSFGFDSVIASAIWIDLLQRSRHQHSGEDSLSWEYVQLDAINRLDPWFERAYSFGGVVLSVLVQDKEGARRILQRWVRRSPRDWHIHYLYGYHLFFELKDFETASKHILRAAELEGAPSWLNSLAVRLLSETGALAESLRLCVSLYDQVNDTEGKDRLSMRIRSLNYKLQLRAWETALEEFRAQRLREPRSIMELSALFRSRVREIASSVTGAGLVSDLAVILGERFPFRYDKKFRKIQSEVFDQLNGPGEVGIFHVQ